MIDDPIATRDRTESLERGPPVLTDRVLSVQFEPRNALRILEGGTSSVLAA
ncbi:hypothetical protein HALLA_05195 [Halostagnicola larsenii XH-48]|uniref:Uncharacterized protein n=1 Tax=Halostagnicola larsenii XH-48 TaxID=797299 RepID=W0JQ18_9EURY|nr:hypothetical protein HALLA_05195 [Halostagnicola larsenii XH-48]